MTLDAQILRKLDEAKLDDSTGYPRNILDLSIQDRSVCIAKDIYDGNIELALKRISFFIFADSEDKPGEYIHRLILNRSPDINIRTEIIVGHCLYLLPMVNLGRLTRDDYNKVYEFYIRKTTTIFSDEEYKLFKETVKFYEMNGGQLGILSYLY